MLFGDNMWIDYNSIDSEYQVNFMLTVSKCLLLCQKIEKEVKPLIGMSAFKLSENRDVEVLKQKITEGINRTMGQSWHYLNNNLQKTYIETIAAMFPEVPDIRNYFAHDALIQISSFISEPEPLPVSIEEVMRDVLKTSYFKVVKLVKLDNVLSLLLWLQEHKSSLLEDNTNSIIPPIYYNYEAKLISWIFDGFDYKDFMPHAG